MQRTGTSRDSSSSQADQVGELLAGYDPARGAGELYEYDATAADHAVAFFSECLTHTVGDYAGKPFELLPWQSDIVRTMFGWKNRETGLRRYRSCWLELPRKNGKTTLASGLALYLLYCDGEEGAQVVSAAADRDQASLCFETAKGMVEADEMLLGASKIFRKAIQFEATGSTYRPVSADAYTKHGLNLHGLIMDEVHAWPGRDLWDTLQTSTGARSQPLSIAITTAGSSRESLAYEQHDYSVKVRDGLIDDPSHLPIIYSADMDDDWTDPATWAKANPALGHGVQLEYLEREAKRAKEVPGYTNTFLRLHLNVWTSSQSRWLPVDAWEDAPELNVDDLAGRPCYAGLDLATTTDLNALVLVFPMDDETYSVLPYFWIPSESPDPAERSRRDRQPYEVWSRQEVIELSPGAVVDHGLVRKKLEELGEKYDIREIAIDRWNATETAIRLEQDGFTVALFGQGFRSMSGPSKKLEELVVGRKLRHGGHPVLEAHAHAVEIKTDPAENIKPVKSRGGDRIDGVVALVMGLGRAMERPDDFTIYDNSGIRTI